MTPETAAPTHHSRARLLISLAVILIVLMVAVGVTWLATRDTAKAFATAKDVQSELKAGGFDCVSWEDRAPDDMTLQATSEGSCWVNGKKVTITLWDSPEARRNANKAGEVIYRQMGGDLPEDTGTYVEGDAWAVEAITQAQAARVQRILGGEIR